MTILRSLAQNVGKLGTFDIKGTVDQFATNFYMQLDFRDEAHFLSMFGSNFGSSFWKAIVSFPQPVDGLISEHVLVETFERGESVAHYLKRNDMPSGRLDPRARAAIESDSNAAKAALAKQAASRAAEAGGADGSGAGISEVELWKQIALCGVQSYLKMVSAPHL